VSEVRLVQAGFGISSLGDFLALTALTIRVHDTTGSPWAVSGLVLAGLLPLVVMGPPAGMIVDRTDPVRLLRVTLSAQAGIAVALAITSGYPGTLALVFALGTGTAVCQAALLALLPSLVSRDRLGRANGGLEAVRAAGICLGPPLGGLITTYWGTGGALLVDAVTFAVLGGAMFAVRAGRASAGGAPQRTGRLLGGVAHIAREPVLRLAVGVLAGATLFLGGVSVSEVFFAKDTLRAGNLGYGTMLGAWGLGMVVGAIVTGQYTARRDPITILAGGCLSAGVAVCLPALFPSVVLAVVCWFVGGCTNGAYHVAVRTLIHLRTPVQLQGRVFAAQYGAYTAAKLVAMLVGGLLVTWLSLRGAILAMGAATALVGVTCLLVRLPRPVKEQAGHESRDEATAI
jgi:MFS family permease